jgi:hypothetical protein
MAHTDPVSKLSPIRRDLLVTEGLRGVLELRARHRGYMQVPVRIHGGVDRVEVIESGGSDDILAPPLSGWIETDKNDSPRDTSSIAPEE